MRRHTCWSCGNTGWGIFFIFLGMYFLLQDLGYIPKNISIWPIALIVLGLAILTTKSRCKVDKYVSSSSGKDNKHNK